MARAPSIRSQLRRFVALVLLGAGIGAVLLALVLARSVRSEELARLGAVADVSVNAIQSAASSTRELLEELARRPEIRDMDPARCGPFLAETVSLLPRYLGATVTDTLGRVRCLPMATQPDPAPIVTDRAWYQEVRRRDEFTVGSPVEGRLSGTSVIVFAQPIRDGAGATVGYLTLSSPTLERFRALVAALGDEETVVTIATEEGLVVARSRDPDAWVGRMLPRAGDDSLDREELRGVSRAPDGDGVAHMWVYRNVPTYGWRVFAGTPEAAVRASTAARTLPLLAFFLTLLAALAWIMFRLRDSVDRSLTMLVDVMRRSEQDPGVRASESEGPAEVTAVAEQFNRTLGELDAALASEAEAHQRLQAILNNAFFAIFACDTRGRLIGCNPAMVRVLGYHSEPDVRALTIADLFMVPHEAEELLAASEGRRGLLETEWRAADGREVPVRLHWSVFSEPGGRILVQGIAEDLTERRDLELQFRQAQKLEAVGRLAGGVAHDFNNRLTVIGGQAELLLQELAPDDPNREYVEGIVTSAQRAADLTAQLLAFSRRQPLTPRRLDLTRVASELVPMLGRMVGGAVRLETSWGDVPDVLADAGQVEQVLLNLVTNARDAVGGNGRVTISTFSATLSDREARVRGPEVRPGPYAVLAVEDDGEGMNSAVREHIFEPFFTTKPTGKGTGLGLATVYGVTTQYGGHLQVHSSPGSGARFEVWLPGRGAGDDDRLEEERLGQSEADLPLPSGFDPISPPDPS